MRRQYTRAYKTLDIGIGDAERSRIMDRIGDGLKKIILAGIGTVAVTLEKSSEFIDEMVKKGELTVEQGKELHKDLQEEIKQSLKEKMKEKPVSDKEIEKILSRLSAEQLEALKEKIQQAQENAEAEEEEAEAAEETEADAEEEAAEETAGEEPEAEEPAAE